MAAAATTATAALNNHGAHLFSQGNVDSAIRAFRVALDSFMKQVSENKVMAKRRDIRRSRQKGKTSATAAELIQSDSGIRQLRGAQQHQPIMVREGGLEGREPAGLPRTQQATSNVTASNLFVCMRPVLIGPNDSIAATNNAVASVTFNLALCYHIVSTRGGPSADIASVYRSKAMRLYKVAMGLRCKSLKGRLEQEQTWKPNLLDLSIVNNSAQLSYSVGDYGFARGCFEKLAMCLNRFDEPGQCTGGFLSNLMLVLPESILAPAA